MRTSSSRTARIRTYRPPGPEPERRPVRVRMARRTTPPARSDRPSHSAAPCRWAGPGACGQGGHPVAKLYPGCRPLLAEKTTVGAVLQALDGVPVAHLATHGHHDREKALFSRLDLADGPLMAYDIQRLAAAPRHVVLSSCDAGRTVMRPGEETLGFTAALLYTGTATVISSVTRVADETAAAVMTSYHRLLTAGTAPAPAAALAQAALTEQFSPFVCFGSG